MDATILLQLSQTPASLPGVDSAGVGIGGVFYWLIALVTIVHHEIVSKYDKSTTCKWRLQSNKQNMFSVVANANDDL